MRWSCLLLSLVWSAAVWAIGENCSQIWTQAIRSSSTVPAWGNCFGNNPSCYNVTDATTISSLPATLAANQAKAMASVSPKSCIASAIIATLLVNQPPINSIMVKLKFSQKAVAILPDSEP